ncbi:annexin A7-like [Neophocaena asiaeorientalis asiaeorientalis]|uniref:Annexin A7-like n=1 Tax=Neophocaena asiaeorientalis asiaeorientalis TaxID=1706337 RepID=A0A341C3X5_NEOAA|nr:annexin A7-like [Neophocaena asiaeorientalis asiaeorientalis]
MPLEVPPPVPAGQRTPPQEKRGFQREGKGDRRRSPRAFALLPARVQSRSLIRNPDLGSGLLGRKLVVPGREENRFRIRLLPEPDGTGPSRPHPPARLGEGEPAERPDSLKHPGSGVGGRPLAWGYASPPGSFRTTWHTFYVGRYWHAAGHPGSGVGSEEAEAGFPPGRVSWNEAGGEGSRSLSGAGGAGGCAPFLPSLGQNLRASREGRGPGARAQGMRAPRAWAGLAPAGFCSSPFQSAPSPEPSLGAQN